MVFYLYGTLKIITTLKRLFCLFNIFINLLQAVSISFNWKPAGVSVMNLINLSLHLDLMTLSDPLPPPLVSPPPRLTNPTVHPRSRCRPSDEPSPTLRADIFRLLFCRCGWHRWASVSPTWPSYNAALPAKSGPVHPGTGELEWVWPYCAAPASPSHHIPLLRLPFCHCRERFFPRKPPQRKTRKIHWT